MLTQQEILAFDPPPDLTDEQLEAWYRERLCEPDGSMVMSASWDDAPSKPE